jgi:hypothetical protein
MTLEWRKETAREVLQQAIAKEKWEREWNDYGHHRNRDFNQSELRWLAAFREQANG